MKTILFIIILYMSSILSYAQGGINFSNKNYEDLLKEAKHEGKNIFIDVYTVWCGPCKSMASRVFPAKEVGTFYNDNFINAKIDAEKEGKELAKKFGVNSYPTLLYITADGKLINKVVGMQNASQLIQSGKVAIELFKSGKLLSNLEEDYNKNKEDEVFMKRYVARKIELKENPTDALEQYLTIQKEMKPEYFEMMEYLMSHSKYLLCGSKGEEILLSNMKEYTDIATKAEANGLKNMPFNIIMQTHRYALGNSDIELFELFLKRWIDSPNKTQFQNINDFRLQLLALKNDIDAYKNLGICYIDSIRTIYTPERVKTEDRIYHEEVCQKFAGGGGLLVDALKKNSENVRTQVTLNAVATVGRKIMSNSKKKKELQKILEWSDYGLSLDSKDPAMKNLKADILKKQGKMKESILLKNEIIKSLPKTDKIRVQLEKELDLLDAPKR